MNTWGAVTYLRHIIRKKIKDSRISHFINEAVNLERVVVGGYISAKEKSGRRKDRVMSLVYGLDYAKSLEDALVQPQQLDWLSYIMSY